jgi:hypothetical protein
MKLRVMVQTLGSAILALGLLAARSADAQGTRPQPDGPRRDPRAELFVRRGCTSCHAISGLGVKASEDVGPDLTYAYVDVLHRYGVNLEYFLYNPVGVMELVLVSHMRITAEDRDSMVHILRGLYEERRADIHDEVPFLPPGRVVSEPVLTNSRR